MVRYRLTCADCGSDDYIASRKDAKYCPRCRVLRMLLFASTSWKYPRKCRACDQKFRPLSARDQKHCGTCSQLYAPARTPEVCVTCSQSRPPAFDGIPVCAPCMKDPAIQGRVLRLLRNGRKQRRAANGDRPHAIERITS